MCIARIVKESEVVMTFSELNVTDNLCKALESQNISEPTYIQSHTYKNISEGRDLIACSSTGSGKTLAYLLPLIEKLDLSTKNVQILILVPTQELAVQVNKQVELLFTNAEIPSHSTFLIGEGNISRQIDALKLKPSVIVGTPARVNQLISMKKLKVHEVKTLVIDEADRLMNKTYLETVLSIRKALMKRTQVLLFSASIDRRTLKTANDLTFKPIVINEQNSNQVSPIPSTIKHIYVITDRRERIETLRKIAKALNNDKTMVFINTRYDLDEALQKLQYHNYKVGALSSNIDKQEKKKALEAFKTGKFNYLLGTDVAARGLQIDNVSAVINVNLPEDDNEYLHRAGRCGRNGNEGLCVSIITENELPKIKRYQKLFKINIVQRKLYNGKLVAK